MPHTEITREEFLEWLERSKVKVRKAPNSSIQDKYYDKYRFIPRLSLTKIPK